MVLFKAPSLRPVVAEASARTRRGGWLCPGGPETRCLCPEGSRGHGPPHLLFTGDTLRGHPQGTPRQQPLWAEASPPGRASRMSRQEGPSPAQLSARPPPSAQTLQPGSLVLLLRAASRTSSGC